MRSPEVAAPPMRPQITLQILVDLVDDSKGDLTAIENAGFSDQPNVLPSGGARVVIDR